MSRPASNSATWLALPFSLVIALFFVLPLLLVVMVSFWDYTSYSIVPDFIFTNYEDIFYGCLSKLPDLCTAFSTYISTLKFVFVTWLVTLVVGFRGYHAESITQQNTFVLVTGLIAGLFGLALV